MLLRDCSGAAANQSLKLTGAAFRFRAVYSRCGGPGKLAWERKGDAERQKGSGSFKHIANAAIMKELTAIVADCGDEIPVICTPEELLGD